MTVHSTSVLISVKAPTPPAATDVFEVTQHQELVRIEGTDAQSAADVTLEYVKCHTSLSLLFY